jgi:hypothetical protein
MSLKIPINVCERSAVTSDGCRSELLPPNIEEGKMQNHGSGTVDEESVGPWDFGVNEMVAITFRIEERKMVCPRNRCPWKIVIGRVINEEAEFGKDSLKRIRAIRQTDCFEEERATAGDEGVASVVLDEGRRRVR